MQTKIITIRFLLFISRFQIVDKNIFCERRTKVMNTFLGEITFVLDF